MFSVWWWTSLAYIISHSNMIKMYICALCHGNDNKAKLKRSHLSVWNGKKLNHRPQRERTVVESIVPHNQLFDMCAFDWNEWRAHGWESETISIYVVYFHIFHHHKMHKFSKSVKFDLLPLLLHWSLTSKEHLVLSLTHSLSALSMAIYL